MWDFLVPCGGLTRKSLKDWNFFWLIPPSQAYTSIPSLSIPSEAKPSHASIHLGSLLPLMLAWQEGWLPASCWNLKLKVCWWWVVSGMGHRLVVSMLAWLCVCLVCVAGILEDTVVSIISCICSSSATLTHIPAHASQRPIGHTCADRHDVTHPSHSTAPPMPGWDSSCIFADLKDEPANCVILKVLAWSHFKRFRLNLQDLKVTAGSLHLSVIQVFPRRLSFKPLTNIYCLNFQRACWPEVSAQGNAGLLYFFLNYWLFVIHFLISDQ